MKNQLKILGCSGSVGKGGYTTCFQIKDDILDVLGDESTIGKPINSDSKHNKATYPSIIGLEASQLRAEKLCLEALKILNKLPYNTDNLIKLSKFIILRNK